MVLVLVMVMVLIAAGGGRATNLRAEREAAAALCPLLRLLSPPAAQAADAAATSIAVCMKRPLLRSSCFTAHLLLSLQQRAAHA